MSKFLQNVMFRRGLLHGWILFCFVAGFAACVYPDRALKLFELAAVTFFVTAGAYVVLKVWDEEGEK